MENAKVNTIDGELGFLTRSPIYQTIKPYSLRFNPSDSSPRNNIETEKVKIAVYDARLFHPTVDENGFALQNFPSKMSYDNFYEPLKIETVYAPEMQNNLEQLFKARKVRIIDYAVRRRHPDFPISTGEEYTFQQPAALAHLDFSHDEAIHMLETIYGRRAKEILEHRWSIINVWKPLKGPLSDWPLAVCDARTFVRERDAESSDAVYPSWAYENVLVQYHPDQKWYYFSSLLEYETMLFKCTDSEKTASGPCPHVAFFNPHASLSENPRESVELRAFVMWAPIEDFPPETGSLNGKWD